MSLGSKEEAEGEVGVSQAELCGAGEQLAGLQSGGWREDFESFIYLFLKCSLAPKGNFRSL